MNWQAKWIEDPDSPIGNYTVFMKEFELDALPGRAELFISGLGFYDASINGRPVSDALLQPVFSAYDKSVYYNRHDVTALLKRGVNRIEVQVCNGRIREQGENCFDFEHPVWKAKPMLLCELHGDGRVLEKTGRSWNMGRGKTTFESCYFGVDYDATMPDPQWRPAVLAKGPGGIIREQGMPAIREVEILKPKKELPNRVYAFEKRTAGNVEVTVRGKRGAKIRIIYGERLGKDGNIDQRYIKRQPTICRTNECSYILGEDGVATWRPTFFYTGFQYVQIVGECEVLDVAAHVFYAELKDVGSFHCSDETVEGILDACRNASRTNIHHTITDCPHREKNGWLGDAHASCEQMLYQYDMGNVYEKYLQDIVDVQWPSGQVPCIAPTSVYGYNFQSGPTWDAALVLIPWKQYLFTGDDTLMRRHYPAMAKYMAYTADICEDEICESGLGDFLPDPSVKVCPDGMMLTGYRMLIARTLVKIAKVLGKEEDAGEYAALAEKIRESMRRHYPAENADTISYMTAWLYFGLACGQAEETAMAQKLEQAVRAAKYRSGGGLFSSVFVLDVLTAHGCFDAAYQVATQKEFPGWAYMLRDGGHTLWETWSGITGSLDHHMRSDVGAWFFRDIAGLRPDEEKPGFAGVILTPHFPKDMRWFELCRETAHGRIGIAMRDGEYRVQLPQGVTGKLLWKGEWKEIAGEVALKI